ncbi:MAG: hypothetical protein ACI9EF_000999 [Pseudohongiellaceae bacterium]|jgi:hypothetical protein
MRKTLAMPQTAPSLHSSRPVRALAALIVALGCSACTVAPQHANNAADLQASFDSWQAGNFQHAAQAAEHVLARTGSPKLSPAYSRQRFYAMVMMTLAHESASFGSASFASSGNGSPLAHLTAASYHAYQGGLSAQSAQSSEETAETETGTIPLIPAELASLAPRAAKNHLDLTAIMVDARLGFASRSGDKLRNIARSHDLTDIDTCNEFLAEAQISDNTRPWVYFAVFQHLTTTSGDQREAYRFGISARNAAKDTQSGFDQASADAIASWIEEDSDYVFACIEDSTPFNRSKDRCGHCGAKNIDFEGN